MIRRRPYKKNDNAHVEQKNWTHVRQLFGYDRVDEAVLVPMMNEIYRAYWNPLQNYFTPVLKLKSKERIGGRVKKVYDVPQTPFKRLLGSSYVPEAEKMKLKDTYSTKNPIYRWYWKGKNRNLAEIGKDFGQQNSFYFLRSAILYNYFRRVNSTLYQKSRANYDSLWKKVVLCYKIVA